MVAFVFRMDWFFTTGVVKVVVEDAVEGATLLLEQQISPASFLKVLQKPKTAPAFVGKNDQPERIISRRGVNRWTNYSCNGKKK